MVAISDSATSRPMAPVRATASARRDWLLRPAPWVSDLRATCRTTARRVTRVLWERLAPSVTALRDVPPPPLRGGGSAAPEERDLREFFRRPPRPTHPDPGAGPAPSALRSRWRVCRRAAPAHRGATGRRNYRTR